MTGHPLHESLVHTIQELYSAEHLQVMLWRKLKRMVIAGPLRGAARTHLAETSHQVVRLEQLFTALDAPVRWTRCPGILGIAEEIEAALDDGLSTPLKSLALVEAAQRLEHYEMAAYGTAAAKATALGLDEVAATLNQSLDEEIAAADALHGVALDYLADAVEAGDGHQPGTGSAVAVRRA